MPHHQLFDLQIHVNGQETFFLTEKIVVKYSEKLRKIIKQEKKRSRADQIRNSSSGLGGGTIRIEIDDFPGGPYGFELVSRFCYNNGTLISDIITVSNVSLLHCCANYLGMTEKMSSHNLLHQTEIFLEGIFYWSWNDIITCLRTSESFDSCGLLQQRLMYALLAKIAQNSNSNNSDISHFASASSTTTSSSTSSSSPNKFIKSSWWLWWFEDLSHMSPKMIELFLKTSNCYGKDNTSLVLTKFLLHYLKTAAVIVQQCNKCKGKGTSSGEYYYSGLAETAVHGVVFVFMEKKAFSCRGLFWVLRVVSGFGLSRECRAGLEKLIAGMLDQATLDDLIVSGSGSGHYHHNDGSGGGGVYDVNLVLRLIKLFVHQDRIFSIQKLHKVGRLMDKYLREIAPDPNLKISKFLAVAESLPDCTRDSFDGIYRAIDIFLESHPSISVEERSRLCRCLNYEKLSLEACKDLAKNPRIPPRIAVQALAAQHCCSRIPSYDEEEPQQQQQLQKNYSANNSNQIILYNKSNSSGGGRGHGGDDHQEEDEYIKLNIQKMQWRVVELEKVCQEMKGQMSRMVKGKIMIGPHAHGRTLPRMC